MLTVFGFDNSVKNCSTHPSLSVAEKEFENLYVRKKGTKPVWTTENIEYISAPGKALLIDGEGLDGVKKLEQILYRRDYEKG